MHRALWFAVVVTSMVTQAAADPGPVLPPPPAGGAMPKPPKELADFGGRLVGAWRCTGSQADVKVELALKAELDLGGWWVRETLTGKVSAMSFTWVSLTSYRGERWVRQVATNAGDHWLASGPSPGKNLSLQGDGDVAYRARKVRETEQWVSASELHLVTELSDDGRAWSEHLDLVCKK